MINGRQTEETEVDLFAQISKTYKQWTICHKNMHLSALKRFLRTRFASSLGELCTGQNIRLREHILIPHFWGQSKNKSSFCSVFRPAYLKCFHDNLHLEPLLSANFYIQRIADDIEFDKAEEDLWKYTFLLLLQTFKK